MGNRRLQALLLGSRLVKTSHLFSRCFVRSILQASFLLSTLAWNFKKLLGANEVFKGKCVRFLAQAEMHLLNLGIREYDGLAENEILLNFIGEELALMSNNETRLNSTYQELEQAFKQKSSSSSSADEYSSDSEGLE
mgnify:CR=1 FL=1